MELFVERKPPICEECPINFILLFSPFLVQVPKNILTGGDTPTNWDKDSLTDVFIFKSDLADSFVIPEFGLGGMYVLLVPYYTLITNYNSNLEYFLHPIQKPLMKKPFFCSIQFRNQ